MCCKRRLTMPENFKCYFWDKEFDQLDLKQNMKYIISRLLTEGDMEAFCWVKDNYSKQDIIETVKTSRRFNKLTANFLKLLYNLDEKEMIYYTNIKDMNYVYKG